jgi:outer membrane protein assembly factor BamB
MPWLRRAVNDPRIVALGLVVAATILSQLSVSPGISPADSAEVRGSAGPDATAGPSASPRSTEPGGPSADRPAPAASVPARSDPATTPGASGSAAPGAGAASRFPGGLLIADRGNGRLLVVDDAGRLLWTFPGPGSLPRGQRFAADDAFVAPDGRTIVANDEAHQVIDRIDIATRRVIWQYGQYGQAGSRAGFLHTPDDAYPLANGDIVVADIRNCRVMQIAPSKSIVRQWGRTGRCVHHPPTTFAQPNGDTPLPDGGLLITEITGSRVVRLDARGRVVFDIHVPVRYPSDAQLDASGNVIVVDYADPGAVLRISPRGTVLWRYGPRSGSGRLNHPSLAVPLPDGTIVLNDDDRQRIVVIDPRTDRIVWQYGRTDQPSRSAGHLYVPDGIDLVPPGIFVPAGR